MCQPLLLLCVGLNPHKPKAALLVSSPFTEEETGVESLQILEGVSK